MKPNEVIFIVAVIGVGMFLLFKAVENSLGSLLTPRASGGGPAPDPTIEVLPDPPAGNSAAQETELSTDAEATE